ncbi:MAG: hypothetical protein LWX55_15955 [Deltaproteobacteria bacterium]|jgi:ABC-type multidrug transport system fused ATPase/permease subunit|nr:hypothetical protein [Deltaproteobacteria bacterium]
MKEKTTKNEETMLQTEFKLAFILSAIIVVLMVVASVGGLFINGIYHDNLLVTSGWYCNDLVTLLLAVPLLILSLVLSKRDSQRPQLVWFGLLGGVWLWKRQPWGYVLTVIWNVKGAVYMTALSAATVGLFQAGVSEDIMQIALWGPIGVGCLISFILLLSNMESSEHKVQ